jgi:hypothetical protein
VSCIGQCGQAVIGVASGAGEALPEAGFAVRYLDAAGGEHRGELAALCSVCFEQVSPVRSFGSYRGQRSFQGAWWFATTGEHVVFESWLERDTVMMLDFDREVVAVSAQPFWLVWSGERGRWRHAPDLFARRVDGAAVVIDVRADDRIRAEDAEAFAATERACASVGWGYRRVGVVDELLATNVRWLSGYRHRRCLDAPIAMVLMQRLAVAPMTVSELAHAVGDGVAVLPTLYHLMWRRVIAAELSNAPLSARTVVRVERGAA